MEKCLAQKSVQQARCRVAHAYNPSTFESLKRASHLRSGVQDQPGKTPSLLKIQKLARYGGSCL